MPWGRVAGAAAGGVLAALGLVLGFLKLLADSPWGGPPPTLAEWRWMGLQLVLATVPGGVCAARALAGEGRWPRALLAAALGHGLAALLVWWAGAAINTGPADVVAAGLIACIATTPAVYWVRGGIALVALLCVGVAAIEGAFALVAWIVLPVTAALLSAWQDRLAALMAAGQDGSAGGHETG